MSLAIAKTVRTYPPLPFADMKNAILGTSYTLSLTFVGKDRARALNMQYRNATYIPNVLSFPLDKNTGEIFITPAIAKKEARKFNLSPKGHIGFLFIHGLLHLKGYPHGATMEKAEKKYMQRFGLR